MERPADIVLFERVIFASLALGILNSWLAWPELVAPRGPAFVIIVLFFSLGIPLILARMTSRRRSNVAKWIFVVLFVLGLPVWLAGLLDGSLPGSWLLSCIQAGAQLLAIALLFTNTSRLWFKGTE